MRIAGWQKNQRGRFPSLHGEAPSSVLPGRLPVPGPSGLFRFDVWRLSYGAGTLITVFTMVTDALSPNALPFSVVMAALPAVENVTPA